MLSQVLLFMGILFHAATEGQSNLAIAFSYRDHFIQRSYSSKHQACSLSKSHRKICVVVPERSTEVPGQWKFHFVCFPPLSKVYCVCLSVGRVCKSKVLQNYLKTTKICLTPRKKRKQPQETDFLNWLSQDMTILKWLSFKNPPVTAHSLSSATCSAPISYHAASCCWGSE